MFVAFSGFWAAVRLRARGRAIIDRGSLMQVRNQKDFAAGAMYMVIGVGAAGIASTYRMGTPTSMGPGYFPFCLGVILTLIGAVLLFNAMRRRAERNALPGWRPSILFYVVASVAAFGLLLGPMGLIVALVAMIGIASRGSDEFTWTTTLINSAVLIALCVAIFRYGLGLPLHLLPKFIAS